MTSAILFIDKRDGDSNTGVTVLRLDELGGWIMEQKEVMNKEVIEKVEGVFEWVGEGVEKKREYEPNFAGFISKIIDIIFGTFADMFDERKENRVKSYKPFKNKLEEPYYWHNDPACSDIPGNTFYIEPDHR